MIDPQAGLDVEALIARQRTGFTLEQPFYTSPEIFDLDVEGIVSRMWLFVDHASRIPNPGDYFLYDVAGESIIIVRDKTNVVRALFNVCRHRGSRVCLEAEGHKTQFVCPYHAWSYGLDGQCIRARDLPADLDRGDYALHACRARVLEGLIYINLSRDEPPDFDVIAGHVQSYLALHQLEGAKIAHREVFPTDANWKLVVENFRECAHCLPAHPEYAATYDYVRACERGGPRAFEESIAAWGEDVRARGHPAGIESWEDGFADQPHYARRRPIGQGIRSLTEDGGPAAPLMGRFEDYDGGDTVVWLHPFHAVWSANDHTTLFRFTPVAPRHTEVMLTWLVRGDAEEGIDYDVERLAWLWHVTTVADTRIINDNQKGVNSRRYAPGPYLNLEANVAKATAWYLDQLRDTAQRRLDQDRRDVS